MSILSSLQAEQANNSSIRELESLTIANFVACYQHYLVGRVLDFGCGVAPYRGFAKHATSYTPYDKNYPGYNMSPVGPFDSILCTQVVEYAEDPVVLLDRFYFLLSSEGALVMTYPTCWDEVERTDFWRFTKTGMELLLRQAKFDILIHERRAEVKCGGFTFPLGYGVVARKK